MRYSEVKLDNICKKLSQNFECPSLWTLNERANSIEFRIYPDNGEYIYTVGEYKLNLLSDPTIADLAITSFEQQLGKINKPFIVRILPFDMSININNDKQLTFEDVSGIITGDYPKIEIQQASNPIKVTMVVPEGYYIVEDHS